MKIYIDLVFIVNFIFDLILLISVNYILRRNVRWSRLILSSLFGSLTIFVLFFKMSRLVLIIYKTIIAILMILIGFGYKNFNYLKKNITYFYLVSMLLGGGIYFLNSQFSYTNKGLVFNNSGLKFSYLIVICISLLIYLKYMFSFKDLKNNYSNYYKCKIYFDKRNYIEVNAFLDTGNKLKDPYSRKSIILLDKNKISDINIRSPIYVPYNSLNNHGLLTCFKALRLEINGKSIDKFLVGISQEKFFIDGIDCIISSSIMEGLK